jgi:hypothetical protein
VTGFSAQQGLTIRMAFEIDELNLGVDLDQLTTTDAIYGLLYGHSIYHYITVFMVLYKIN